MLIGEMRDLETIEAALRIAETGHLTLATLHTNSATTSINRIIDVFPAHQQSQIRTQLSFVLEGIMCQALLERSSGKGRVMALEILVPERRHPEPDPRGQDPPDLLDDADRPGEVRHADLQPVARDALPEETDHAGSGALALVDARRAAGAHQPRRRRQRADGTTGDRPARGPRERCRITSGREGTAPGSSRRACSSPTPRRSRWRPCGARTSSSPASASRARKSRSRRWGPKVRPKNLAVFTRQFSVMIDAGLPLVQCLEILANQQEHKNFAKILLQVRQDVEAGSTLADAMRRHPKAFDDLYVNMIAAGEAGGILDTILQRLSTYIEKAVKLRSQVRAALDLPDRRHHDRGHRRGGHPAEGHPDVRRSLHEPRRRAAVPHPRRHRVVQFPGALLHLLRHRHRRLHLLLPPLLQDLPRPTRHRRRAAEDADPRR